MVAIRDQSLQDLLRRPSPEVGVAGTAAPSAASAAYPPSSVLTCHHHCRCWSYTSESCIASCLQTISQACKSSSLVILVPQLCQQQFGMPYLLISTPLGQRHHGQAEGAKACMLRMFDLKCTSDSWQSNPFIMST